MSTVSELSRLAGLMHKVFRSGDVAGMTLAHWNKLAEKPDLFAQIPALINGHPVITQVKHLVDLGASPRLPFAGAEVVKHEGVGVVEIELRSDDNLYIDGKKVNLVLSERQKGDNEVVGNELRQELEGGEQVLLNSNVLDCIYDHPELFPEHWKRDENGDTRYIFFWGSIFRSPTIGYLRTWCLYWYGDVLKRQHDWLGNDLSRHAPSASVAS